MKRGMATGWMPPAVPIRKVLAQIEQQWVTDITQSPLYKPFEDLPEGHGGIRSIEARRSAREAIAGAVIPALKELHKFISESYLPACRQEIAASALPGGPAYYQAQIRWLTTTDFSSQEIHEIGKREVARIRAAMDAVIKQAGFSGIVPGIPAILADRSRFARVPTPDVLPGFRDIAKRVDPELPKLFAELPARPTVSGKSPLTAERPPPIIRPARPMVRGPVLQCQHARGIDQAQARDGSVCSCTRPCPGIIFRSPAHRNSRDLPEFRRNGLYNAYVEGWALYAESLGEDLGLYKDPYSKFGRLNGEIHRACRLVVDTGMHALGWTRDQAIAYMKANTGLSDTFIVAEVDRYIVWPGQALGYKLGELKIKELRQGRQGPRSQVRHPQIP